MSLPTGLAAHILRTVTLHGLRPLGSILGRSVEIQRTINAIRTSPLVTVTGPGGVGKTRLVQEIATRLADSGRDVWLIELRGLTDANLLATEVAAALQTAEIVDESPADRLVRGLREHVEALVVLDNLEQINGAGPVLELALRKVGGARVLTTSRFPLGVTGEVEIPLGPLAQPKSGSVSEVLTAPASALFVARSRELGQLIDLDEQEADEVFDLCRRLDGLPLALELAARRTRVLSPKAILRRLNESPGNAVLQGTQGAGGPHDSLEAVIDWSLTLLRPADRDLLVDLSAFAGTFDLDLAQLLSTGHAVLEGLDALVAHGLIRREDDLDGEPRFRMLETIRSSSAARLDASETEALLARHLKTFVTFAESLRPALLGPDPAPAIARLEPSIEDLRNAFEWGVDRYPAQAAKLLENSWRLWSWHGRIGEAAERAQRVLDRLPEPTADRLQGLIALIRFTHQLRGPGSALEPAAEARHLARSLGDVDRELDMLRTLSLSHGTTSLSDALPYAREYARLADLHGREQASRDALAILGGIEIEIGDYEGGSRHSNEAIKRARDANDAMGLAIMLANLSEAELHVDQPAAAAIHARESVQLFRPIDGGPYLVRPLAHLGWALAESGHLSEARRVLAEAAEIAARLRVDRISAHVVVCSLAYLCATGADEAAARGWGWVSRMDAAGLQTIDPAERPMADRVLAAAASHSPSRFETALGEGASSDGSQILQVLGAALAGRAGDDGSLHSRLTAREREVARLLGRGMGDREIAEELGISTKTASVHVSNVKAKLGSRSRLDAAMAGKAIDDLARQIS